MTLGRIIGDFKSLSTKEFWKFYDGKLWQRQFFDHVIRNEQDFFETIKYIRLNPVKANFVENWEDWRLYGEPIYNSGFASLIGQAQDLPLHGLYKSTKFRRIKIRLWRYFRYLRIFVFEFVRTPSASHVAHAREFYGVASVTVV